MRKKVKNIFKKKQTAFQIVTLRLTDRPLSWKQLLHFLADNIYEMITSLLGKSLSGTLSFLRDTLPRSSDDAPGFIGPSRLEDSEAFCRGLLVENCPRFMSP